MIDEKTCTHCRVTKSVGAFGKHTRSKDGLQCWCKECKREHYQANSGAIADKAKARYGNGGRPADMPWPDRPIAYSTAHQRVRATYGAAKNYPCSACGDRAHAWSYDHSDPNPLWHKGVGLFADKPTVPYSPDPWRYDPMCRSCHVKRDSYGAA